MFLLRQFETNSPLRILAPPLFKERFTNTDFLERLKLARLTADSN